MELTRIPLLIASLHSCRKQATSHWVVLAPTFAKGLFTKVWPIPGQQEKGALATFPEK